MNGEALRDIIDVLRTLAGMMEARLGDEAFKEPHWRAFRALDKKLDTMARKARQ